MCSMGVEAQNGEMLITGAVTDASGYPLIGANIVIKDQPGVGTITDIDGKYKLKANPYNVLIFTYIGFDKQEVLVKDETTINIILKESDENVLDEVVVTGAGAQKKATVTGAITTVTPESLKIPTANITNALGGTVAGVISMQQSGEPGSNNSEFWIRGISTFGAGKGALVLIDGFERPFNEINVEDIESFSVLKDASATALYGSRGANGVILITTKQGDMGKIDINAKIEYGFNTRTRTPEFVDGNVYANLVNEALVTRNKEPLYTPLELEVLKSGLDPDLYPNVNWKDVMLRDGAELLRATLNLSGGGSTVRYFVSGSFLDEGGMYKSDKALKDYKTNTNITRWNYRANVDMNITKTSLLKLGFSGFLQKRNRPGLADDIWHSIVGQNPISIPVMYSNGLVPAFGTGNRTNPWVLATQTGYRENWTNVAEVNLTFEQDLKFLLEGLKFNARFGYDTRNENHIHRLKWPEQYNTERRRDRDGNLIMKRISSESLMHQTAGAWGERKYVFEAELMYDWLFANAHRVGALLKYNQQEVVTTSDVGDNIIEGIARRNMGLSGRIMYNYKERYLAEFNFGYTGSENFKKGNQFGFFPAIAFGWNIAQEKFIRDKMDWLSLFKVRYSYGLVGNDNVGTRFPFLSHIGGYDGYDFGDFNSPNNYGGLHYTQVASENLTWEVAKKHNLGFDVSILNGKFSGTLDIFKDVREDIFMRRRHLPDIVGISSEPWANVGKMQTKGFDGQLNYNERISKVELTFRGNITYAKNKVLDFDEQETAYPYTMTRGYRWEQARGLIAEGLFKDFDDIRNSPTQHFGEVLPGDIKYKDVNGDGVVNDDDVVAIGSTRVPNLIYGMGMSLYWNNFDFNIHFQGSGKSAYFIDGASVYPFIDGAWGNILTEVGDPKNRWISREISGSSVTENPKAKYPRLSYGGNGNNYRRSTHWLRDGSYVRLKNLELGYTFPKHWLSSVGVGNVRLYFMGHNLAVWDKLKIWDPELGSGNGMAYPLTRSFTLGMTISL